MVAQEQLLQLVAKATKRQSKRAQRNQTRTRSSLLYLNMLNEMRKAFCVIAGACSLFLDGLRRTRGRHERMRWRTGK